MINTAPSEARLYLPLKIPSDLPILSIYQFYQELNVICDFDEISDIIPYCATKSTATVSNEPAANVTEIVTV